MAGLGFIKVMAAAPEVFVGNPASNMRIMRDVLARAEADMVVFPELSVTGYTAGDLFFQGQLLSAAHAEIKALLKDNPYDGFIVLGAPFDYQGLMYNAAWVIKKNQLLGIVPKLYVPNTQEYYEKRWFTSGLKIINEVSEVSFDGHKVPFGSLLFTTEDETVSFGVEVCEDMWAPFTPGNLLALKGAKMILNISASNETFGKREVRKRTIIEHSRKNMGAYIYASAGASESTSETVFSGHLVMASTGELIQETEDFNPHTVTITGDIDLESIRFKRQHYSSFRDLKVALTYPVQRVKIDVEPALSYRFDHPLDATPFVPKKDETFAFKQLSSLLEAALYKRLSHIGAKTVICGVSGGLDSTLALMIAARVADKMGLKRTAVWAVMMPAKANSARTKTQADALSEALGVTRKVIPIDEAVNEHFSLIEHDGKTLDTTYENAHARMRTLILMNLANLHQGIVLGTGDMSELALGFATYNGDQMSMYGINQGIPKTLVRFLVRAYGKYAFSEDLSHITTPIIKTPISPELIPGQESESMIGSYEINDFIMARFLRHGDKESRIAFLLETVFKLPEAESKVYVSRFFGRFFNQKFKRQASPDAPKVIDIALSPRTDFRLPSDISYGDQNG